MRFKKVTIIAACIGLPCVLVLSGCGGGQPSTGSAGDLAAAAQQTVAVILTSTAQAQKTGQAHQTALAVPTAKPTLAPPTAAPTTPPAAGETPGLPHVEPTRNVVYETPSGNVVQEPGHEATIEPTK